MSEGHFANSESKPRVNPKFVKTHKKSFSKFLRNERAESTKSSIYLSGDSEMTLSPEVNNLSVGNLGAIIISKVLKQ